MAASDSPKWSDLLRANPAVLLALSGILLYAFLSASYAIFYHSLGVDLNDVGLTYATILASSVGPIIIILSLTSIVVFLWSVLRRLNRRPSWLSIGILVFLAVGVYLPVTAFLSANEVKDGNSIARTFPATAIHANSVTVASTAEGGKEMPAIQQLSSNTSLLYLGKSDGTVVLYDPTVDEAVYVPAALVTLRIKN
jgi:hypothetical protein